MMRRLPAVAAAVLVTSGCSLAVMAPPAGPVVRGEASECTPWRVASVVDAVGGAGLTLLAFPGGSKESSCPPGERCLDFSSELRAVNAVILGTGVLLLASSFYGMERTGRCTEILGMVNACNGGDARACARLGRPTPVPSPWPTDGSR